MRPSQRVVRTSRRGSGWSVVLLSGVVCRSGRWFSERWGRCVLKRPHDSQDAAHYAWSAHTTAFRAPTGSPRSAATSSAALKAPSPPSTPRCSGPGSSCCAEATPSPTPTGCASTPSSTPTPASKPAGRHCKSCTAFYLADDYDGALKALGRFCDLYETGELPEYHDTVDTIIAWTDQILAWHHSDRASNGRIEGTILWSVSKGVVDVADGYVAGCGGRVIWIVSSESAMLLAA